MLATSRLSTIFYARRYPGEPAKRGKFLILELKLLVGGPVLVKAIYENNVLRPLEKLDLEEGDVVEIEVKKDAVDRLGGLVKISRKDLVDEIIESPELELF